MKFYKIFEFKICKDPIITFSEEVLVPQIKLLILITLNMLQLVFKPISKL